MQFIFQASEVARNNSMQLHETPAGKTISSLNDSHYEQNNIKFRIAHALVKHDESFRDFQWMCSLQNQLGLHVDSRYVNDVQCRNMLGCIAAKQRQANVDLIRDAPFISIIMDGSSDFTGEELEAIYIRSSHHGIINDTFLRIASPKSTASADLKCLIDETMDQMGLTETYSKKLIGLCADGAANMQGRKSGLVAHLLKEHPELTAIHCLAHRVELSFKDLIKYQKCKQVRDLYDKSITLLMGLYYLYRRSSKLKHMLIATFDATETTPILPTRVGGTRWVPHLLRAVQAFFKGYKAIVSQLSSASQPPVRNSKAEGLAKLATDVGVVTFLLTSKEMLSPLSALSLDLQKRGQTLAASRSSLEATLELLLNLASGSNPIVEVLVTHIFLDQPLKAHGAVSLGYRQTIFNKLVDSLRNRLPDVPIMTASEVTSFTQWPPKEAKDEIKGFQIVILLSLFYSFSVDAFISHFIDIPLF